eukprot:COSAG03_NODE_157_length_11420_cov_28.022083_8_plen_114_part_00
MRCLPLRQVEASLLPCSSAAGISCVSLPASASALPTPSNGVLLCRNCTTSTTTTTSAKSVYSRRGSRCSLSLCVFCVKLGLELHRKPQVSVKGSRRTRCRDNAAINIFRRHKV